MASRRGGSIIADNPVVTTTLKIAIEDRTRNSGSCILIDLITNCASVENAQCMMEGSGFNGKNSLCPCDGIIPIIRWGETEANGDAGNELRDARDHNRKCSSYGSGVRCQAGVNSPAQGEVWADHRRRTGAPAHCRRFVRRGGQRPVSEKVEAVQDAMAEMKHSAANNGTTETPTV